LNQYKNNYFTVSLFFWLDVFLVIGDDDPPAGQFNVMLPAGRRNPSVPRSSVTSPKLGGGKSVALNMILVPSFSCKLGFPRRGEAGLARTGNYKWEIWGLSFGGRNGRDGRDGRGGLSGQGGVVFFLMYCKILKWGQGSCIY